jgi:hypothetical protein
VDESNVPAVKTVRLTGLKPYPENLLESNIAESKKLIVVGIVPGVRAAVSDLTGI